ncbi:MAG: YqeG family HAD IIIA-type phosphatase [Clostridia bacterium]|nr:YqeG family HAD IIIA-type phosphatase [Clostridia bacterium]
MISLLSPDERVDAVWEIDLKALAARGISGIIVDVDNTLAAWGSTKVSPMALDWLARARAAGFGLCLLTNNCAARGEHFRDALGIPAVYGWVKPWPWGFRRAMRILGTGPSGTVMVGDQLFTDILGARMLRLYSILVTPISDHELPVTRLARHLEGIILRERRRP